MREGMVSERLGPPYRSGLGPLVKNPKAPAMRPRATKRLMSHEKPRRHGKNSAQNARALATFEQ
jgi:hypothetical protein